MRGRNLIIFLKALDLFSKVEGTTINEMAEHLEIDRRSVHRLINIIEKLGFPIWNEKRPLEREKRWRIESGYMKKLPNMAIPDVKLTVSEIIALYMLKGEHSLFKGTGIEVHIKTALDKLSLFSTTDLGSKTDKIRSLFVAKSRFAKDNSKSGKIIDEITDSILNGNSCYIKYHSFFDDRIKNFQIDPLHFFENDGGLYLLVNTTSFGEIRTLAVERIKKITKTDNSYEYPPDFNPEKLMESAFDIVYSDPMDIRIWFSAGQARYIKEREWSNTQEIQDRDDGSIILSMRTSGWWDIKRWVLSYGPHAKVLEPEDLRNAVMDDLRTAIEVNENPSS